jgi:hypothetical protein
VVFLILAFYLVAQARRVRDARRPDAAPQPAEG